MALGCGEEKGSDDEVARDTVKKIPHAPRDFRPSAAGKQPPFAGLEGGIIL